MKTINKIIARLILSPFIIAALGIATLVFIVYISVALILTAIAWVIVSAYPNDYDENSVAEKYNMVSIVWQEYKEFAIKELVYRNLFS